MTTVVLARALTGANLPLLTIPMTEDPVRIAETAMIAEDLQDPGSACSENDGSS